MKIFKRKFGIKANTLIEVIIAIGIFIMVAPAVIVMVLGSHTGTARSEERLQASAYTQQGVEVARSIRDYGWSELSIGTYGLDNSSGYWELSGTGDILDDKYTRTVTVSDVDAYTKQIVVDVTWNIGGAIPITFTSTNWLTNWMTSLFSWIQTTYDDFNGGYLNSVTVTNNSGGEVELLGIYDWAGGSVFDTIDFTAGGNVMDLYIEDNTLYVLLSSNASEEEFIVLDISDVSHGNITELGSTELNMTSNSLFIYDGYAYVGTRNNSQEVLIVRLSDYTTVNSIDIPSNANTFGLFVTNDILYAVTANSGSEEFYAYDISDPEATISTALGSTEIGDVTNDVYVVDGYAYMVAEGETEELVIVRLSDYTTVNTYNLSGSSDPTSIQVVDGNCYIGREGSGNSELYDLDCSTPEGTITENGSINNGTDNVNALYVEGDFAYTTSDEWGTEEVVVYDITDYTIEGTVDLNGYNNARSVFFYGAYIYAGSDNNTSTVQIVQSGESGWAAPALIDSYDADEGLDAQDVFLDGDYAYMVTENNTGGTDPEFYIIDKTTPSSVSLAGDYDFGADISSVFVSGNYAYLATADNSQELTILDISTKSNPTEVGSYDAAGTSDGYSVFVEGTTAYLGTDTNGSAGEFYAIDVSTPSSPSLLGSYEVDGEVNDSYVTGGTGYLATDHFSNQFIVLDVSNPGGMTAKDTYTAPADANTLDYNSNTIYLATDDWGANNFLVLDVTQPDLPPPDWSTPSRIGSYDSDEGVDPNDVAVDGNYAYMVTENNNGSGDPEFYIMDISTPGSPSLTGSYDLGYACNKVQVSGNYAYLACDNNSAELTVMDISTKSSPSVAGTYNSDEGMNGYTVFVVGTTVYLGTANNGGTGDHEFYVLDASMPASITLDGSYDVTADVNDIYVNGTSAYIGTDRWPDDFIILDVSSPSSISEKDSYDGPSTIWGLDYSSDTVYAAADDWGGNNFLVLDVTEPAPGSPDWATPGLTGSYDSDEGVDPNDVYVDGNYAYMVTENNNGGSDPEFYIIDISTPSSPSLTGSLDLGYDCNKVHVDGNYAYLATDDNSNELVIIDISTKSSPSIAGNYNSDEGRNGLSVFASGNYAYLGTANNNGGSDREFYVLDVSSPGSVTLEDSLEVSQHVRDIYVSGDYAYLATDNDSKEFVVVDVSTPTSISEQYTYDMAHDRAFGVYASGNYAYVVGVNSGGDDDFFIFDISNPGSISLEGSDNLQSTNTGVMVSGDYAFVSTKTDDQSLTIVDISTKSSPSEYGTYDTDSNCNGVFTDGTYAYGACENDSSELQIIEASTGGGGSFISLIDQLDLGTNNLGVKVSGTGAYVATNDGALGFTVVDITTPASSYKMATFDTGSACNGIDFSGSYAYAACENDSYEMQVIGPGFAYPSFISLTGGADLASDNMDVAVYGDYCYVATQGGWPYEGLTVVDVSTPSSPSEYSSYNTGDATGVAFDGTYAYLSTEEDSLELQVVGPDIAGSYARWGMLTSSTFDSSSAGTVYDNISWSESGSGAIGFQLRTSSSEAGLSSATWVGPGGATGAFYTVSGTTITTDPYSFGTRWIQYRAQLTGSGSSTPVLEDITIQYEQ